MGMMVGLLGGAPRDFRGGCLSLAAIVALLAVTSDPADARRHRRHHYVKRVHVSESYSPPYAAIVVDARNGAVLHESAPTRPATRPRSPRS